MPKFGKTSLTRLETCHEDLQLLFKEVIKHYDCTIVQGHRGQEEQDKYFAEGKSKLKFPKSKHNKYPSLAVDAAPYEKGGIDWSEDQMYFFAGYVLATAEQLYQSGIMQYKVRLGADWDSDKDINDQSFKDIPHFELVLT